MGCDGAPNSLKSISPSTIASLHDVRFHLIDRIEEIRHGHHVVGTKCVSLSDDVFDQHFPGHPIFPGTLVLEGMAQLAGSFFEMTMHHRGMEQKHCVLAMANRVKWLKPAEPGDRIVYRADILSFSEEFGVARVKAEIDGEPSASAELTFTFVQLGDGTVRESREELYRICTAKTRYVDGDGTV